MSLLTYTIEVAAGVAPSANAFSPTTHVRRYSFASALYSPLFNARVVPATSAVPGTDSFSPANAFNQPSTSQSLAVASALCGKYQSRACALNGETRLGIRTTTIPSGSLVPVGFSHTASLIAILP